VFRLSLSIPDIVKTRAGAETEISLASIHQRLKEHNHVNSNLDTHSWSRPSLGKSYKTTSESVTRHECRRRYPDLNYHSGDHSRIRPPRAHNRETPTFSASKPCPLAAVLQLGFTQTGTRIDFVDQYAGGAGDRYGEDDSATSVCTWSF
jgi:hypothetical protein